jgi:cytidine deaminase
MLLDDGTILTGTAPDAINPSVEVCHEVEPHRAAFRLGRRVLASVCLHREPTVVLWKPLKVVLPDYWMTAFPDEIDAGWTT